MQVHSALSKADGTANALDEVCREVTTSLSRRSVDLAFAFFSPDHAESADLLVSTIHERLRPRVLLGCSAESVIGDTASGAQEPGANRLLFNDTVVDAGDIGVAVTGAVCIRTIVSQGCRPIGDRFMITQAEQNVIHELSGKPALERLREVFSSLSATEQRQAERALHMGIVIDEHKDQFERGDFLIRNLIGVDQKSGSLAVADYVRVGQTAQFQIRDGASASEDLRALLTGECEDTHAGDPIGALLFSCNGRGQRFFRTPHHDVTAVREKMGGIPVGGFFAMGEIGPVGGNNFLHGYTASVALFCKNV